MIDNTARLLPPPEAMGIPPKFSTWRHFQDTAIWDIAESDQRFVMAVMATGAGKSLAYVALSVLLNVRTAVLTQSKALMAQLQRDFSPMGMVSISGMGSYRCLALEPGGELFHVFGKDQPGSRRGHRGCDDGPCRVGADCGLRDGGCTYYDAVRTASREELINSNYDYWMFAHKFGRGLGDFGLLVLDEAHNAPDKLSDFLTVTVEPEELRKVQIGLLQGQPTFDQWRSWAIAHRDRLTPQLDAITAQIKIARENQQAPAKGALQQARDLQNILGKLALIQDVDSQWVSFIDEKTHKWTFTPIWPARYAERYLFKDIPKVVLTSATVRPKTATYLGIPKTALRVLEYPSVFPLEIRPIYWIPTVLVHHKMTDDDIATWLRQIDNILRARMDRKGLIHTVSYARARSILLNSQYARHMIVHSSEGTKLALERFENADPPAFLLSPSVGEGYDFPDDRAEFQIITKIPFLDTRDPVLQARKERDTEYDAYRTAQALVQMCGRIVRSDSDFGESFIVDDHWAWVQVKYRHLMPNWFLGSVQRRLTIPPAPPRRIFNLAGERRLA